MEQETITADTIEFKGRASYEPESNKLRLYVGRVPRDEYLALRADGWTSTPKQDCDFVAHWTPSRRDTALKYAGVIEDEDMSPQERAADRAERFGGYLEKRLDEAGGHADRYDAGPHVHGFQNYGRAVRAADRHDRIGTRAVDAWDKAEYWQRRTAGVIAHALHVSSPAVRMGRIKELEAELRKRQKDLAEYAETFRRWSSVMTETDPEQAKLKARYLADYVHGDYAHPVTGKESSLYRIADDETVTGAQVAALWLADHSEPRTETEWTRHLTLRLAYENQMLEAQGGRAAFVEMEVGGWIGRHQIRKVNKSAATGRVVSVTVAVPSNGHDQWGNEDKNAPAFHLRVITTERMGADVYRAPTDEDRAALVEKKKAEKAEAPKADPCPLINPADDDAERLQEAINERHAEAWTRHHGKPTEHYGPKKGSVQRITQAVYSANSKGSYARAETRGLSRNMELADRASNMYSRHESERRARIGAPVCQIRITGYDPVSVIVLTDKPQKPLPSAVWQKPASVEAVHELA